MTAIKNSILLLGSILLLASYMGCEKDDICLADTPATPSLVLGFFDIDNPEVLKDPGNLSIRPVGIDTLLFASGTIHLNLRTDQEFTEFEFILNEGNSETENTDRIQIHYDREDVYINRACGYRARFQLGTTAVVITQDENNWIKDFIRIEPNIDFIQPGTNEETTIHLGLLH